MTLGNAVIALGAVRAVLYEEKDGRMAERTLPFKVKYRLTRIKDALEKEGNAYEAQRQELVRKHGDEIEKEGGEKVVEVKDPAKLELFYKEMEEALATEIDVDFLKLRKAELEAIENIDINISEIQIRTFFDHLVEND